jgi:drug/metabolite transporter (DMT)-like permease
MSSKEGKASFFSTRRGLVITALFYTFLWGSAFPLVKMCMESFSVTDTDNASKCLVAGIRFTLSGLLTLTCSTLLGKPLGLPRGRALLFVSSYGVSATALQYAFTYIGLSMIDGSKGAVYDQLGVFVIVLAGGLVFREDRLDRGKALGCVLGFLGVVAINFEGLSFSFSLGGEGIMLLAVVCQTLSYFIAKGASASMSAPALVGWGQTLGGILLTAVSILAGGRMTVFSGKGLLLLVSLALISALAYTLSLIPLRYFPVSEVSSFNLLITVFGVVMSALLLGENVFRISYLVSLILIASGITLINARKRT